MSKHSGRSVFWVAMAAVVVFGVLPLGAVAAQALGGGVLSETLAAGDSLEALWNTIVLAVGTSVFALALGTPIAWLVVRTDLPGRRLLRSLIALPYLIPPYIAAVAWINLASPEIGLLNLLLGSGSLDIYSMTGMVWVLGLCFQPFVFLSVAATLESADPSLEDAARMSGAGTWRVFRDISLPLVRGAMASSGGLVFMATASAFGAPALLGSEAHVHVLSTRIYESVTSGLDGLTRASSLATLLFAFALVPTLLRPRRHAVVGGKASQPSTLPLAGWRLPILLGLWSLVVIAVLLPAAAVASTAFMRIPGSLAPANLTLENFRTLGDERALSAVWNSLLLAGGAATLATLLGGLVAWVQTKTRLRGRGLLSALAGAPLAMPGTVLALGLILVWSRPIPLTNTLWILLIAYVAKYTALAARPVAEGLGAVDDALPDAARMSGASGLFLVRTIWIPLALPALIAGWFLVFMPCLSELTMSVLLVGPGIETVGTRMFELQEYAGPTAASVLATAVLAAVVAANLLLRWVSHGRYGI